MTIPAERTRAVLHTERFLLDLCNPKKTPRVPKQIREEARRLLKHYPTQFSMMYIDESFEPLKEINYEQRIYTI
jgi:hypothetical protein